MDERSGASAATGGRRRGAAHDARRPIVSAALLCAAILAADLLLPPTVAAGVLYVVPLLLSLWRGDSVLTRRLAALCAALVVAALAGHAWRGELAGELWLVLVNRALALFAIGVTASLAGMRLTQERELVLARERFASTLSSIADAVIATDAEGRVAFLNPVAERLTGWTEREALGRPLHEVCVLSEVAEPEDGPARGTAAGGSLPLVRDAADPADGGAGATPMRRARLRTRDGRSFPIDGTCARTTTISNDGAGAAPRPDAGLVLVFHDATERESYERSMEQLAYRDALTGLPNRSSLEDRLDLELAHARRNEECLALLFLDLDGFKSINDTKGHRAGDALLAGVAERLRRCLREGDTVARLGGDEFTVLLPRIAGPRAAALVAKKIVESLRDEPVLFEGEELNASPSIGIALFPEHAAGEEELLRLADAAMYAAKHAGGGCWRFHRDEAERGPGREGRPSLVGRPGDERADRAAEPS